MVGLAVAIAGLAAIALAARSATRTHAIAVDPGIGEFFVPQQDAAFLAPVSAAAAYAHMNGHPAPIPPRVTARYGLLTMPLGPDGHGGLRYVVKDRPVWAFTTPGCAISPQPPIPGHRAIAPRLPTPCLSWHFIDARNNGDLGGVG